MRKVAMTCIVLCLLGLFLGMVVNQSTLAKSEGEKSSRVINIAGGKIGGNWHHQGVAMAEIWQKYLPLSITVQAGGGIENIRNVAKGKVTVGYAVSPTLYYASRGEKMFKEPIRNLRAIMTVMETPENLVVLKASGIKSVHDLKGKKVDLGAAGSSFWQAGEAILKAHGISTKDIKPTAMGGREGCDALLDKRLDAVMYIYQPPSPLFMELVELHDVNFISFDQNVLKDFVKEYPYYSLYTIDPNTYKKQDYPVYTFSQTSLLIVTEDEDPAFVKDLLKTFFDHKEEVGKLDKVAARITLKNASAGAGIPYHAAAKQFYQSHNVWIPKD